MCQAYYRGTECVELGIFGAKRIFYNRQGHPMDLFHKISVLLAIFCWLGDVEVMICPWKESVVGNLMSEIAAMCCQKPLPHSPLPLTPYWTPNFLLPPTLPPPPWRAEFCRLTTPKLAINVWTYICWETSQYIRLQVEGAPCLLGTLPLVFKQSPKILKMASESFIHALLLFLCLFLKISHWVPLNRHVSEVPSRNT